MLQRGEILGGIVVDDDAVLGQGGNVGDGVAVDVDLHQADAVGQIADVRQTVIVHGDIGQIRHAAQRIEAVHLVVGALNHPEGTVLRPGGEGADVVVGEVEYFQIGQRGEGGNIVDRVVGEAQLFQLDAGTQGGNIGQLVVVQFQGFQQLQVGDAVYTGK